jgi:hypothetical protein
LKKKPIESPKLKSNISCPSQEFLNNKQKKENQMKKPKTKEEIENAVMKAIRGWNHGPAEMIANPKLAASLAKRFEKAFGDKVSILP